MAQLKVKIALVTGGNKGIGLAVVKGLAAHPNIHVLLGARDVAKGKQAVESLGKANVSFLHVDIDDEKSIQSAAEQVKKTYDGLDILVNNAAIAFKGDAFDENVARTTLKTNYFGTLNMLTHFLPIVREGGRVVNVSSSAGVWALSRCSKELQNAFLKPDLTVDELTGLMNKFADDVAAGKWEERGWPKSAYGISKVGLNMLNRITARDFKTPRVLINAVHPGYVATDMSSFKGPLTTEQGAETPLYACFLPDDGPHGAFFSDKQQAPYIDKL